MTARPQVSLAAVLLALAVAGCAAGAAETDRPASTSASATPQIGPSASPSAPPTPSGSTTPATPTPAPSVSASETLPPPAAPSAETFWAAASAAIDARGRVRVRVIGPSPGELRFEPRASATAVNGEVVFVCTAERAFDGQSGFDELPGRWTCGSAALVHGFRLAGLPMDAWSPELPTDDAIEEAVEVLGDGTWRWSYHATNPVFGGAIEAIVTLDPVSGEIRSAERTDPTGETTYAINYSEEFPAIAVPS